MTPSDLVKLGGLIMGWLLAIIMFIVMLVILFTGLLLSVEVCIICYKEIKNSVRRQ